MSGRSAVAWVAVLSVVGALSAGCATSGDQSSASSVTTTVSTTVLTTTVTSAAASSTSAQPASAYTGTLVAARGTSATTTFDVRLPALTGGEAPVRERFNTGMRSALTDVVDQLQDSTVTDGELLGAERSRVTTTTDHVVAGVAIFSAYGRGAAHPNNSVATITVNAETAQPILLSEVFTDQNAAAARLATLVTRLDERAQGVRGDIGSFANWVPLQSAFHVYVPVTHAAGDYLPVTVPWRDITDLLKPGMAEILAG